MARYILIDNVSGYVMGDTADLPKHTFAGDVFPIDQSRLSPVAAAMWLDEAVIHTYGRRYEECGRHELNSNETGYHLYRADIDGSEAVPLVYDGQDRDTIEAVERDCEYVTSLRIIEREG
jgi:hypothetical protein